MITIACTSYFDERFGECSLTKKFLDIFSRHPQAVRQSSRHWTPNLAVIMNIVYVHNNKIMYPG